MRVSRHVDNGRKFPSFEMWFDHISEKLQSEPNILDNHLVPQGKFINEDTKVFKFEDGIIESLEQVQIDLGVKFDFTKNFHGKKSYGGIVVKLPKKSIALICDMYASDFDEFSYELEEASYFNNANRH